MGKKKKTLTDEEKFYQDLINVLYEVYNNNINIQDQNMLFYAAKKFLQGNSTDIYNEFKEITEKPEIERDEADKLFVKFFKILNRQNVSPNPTLANFESYVKSYVDAIKTRVGNIYYTPRLNSGVTVSDKSKITEEEKQKIERDLRRPARIDTLLEMSDRVNQEIEKTLHTINSNIVLLFGKFNTKLGDKNFREFINKYYKYQQDMMNEDLSEEERIVAENKRHLLVAGYKKMVEDLYFVTEGEGKNANSNIEALKILDKAIEISKRDMIVRRETEPLIELLKKMSKEEMLYLVDFAADDYTSFLNMDPQVLTKVLSGKKDLACFMEFYGLTNVYLNGLNIQDGKFTTDEIIVGMYFSKDEAEFANILQQIDPIVQSRVKKISEGYRGSYETSSQVIKDRVNIPLDRLIFSINYLEYCKTGLFARRDQVEICDLDYIFDKNPKDFQELENLKTERHKERLEESLKIIKSVYNNDDPNIRFNFEEYKKLQGKFISARDEIMVNPNGIENKALHWVGDAKIKDNSIKKNVDCVVMGMLIKGQDLRLSDEFDLFVHVTKQVGDDSGLYGIELSILPSGCFKERVQLRRLENTKGVVQHGNRAEGDSAGKVVIDSTTHWHVNSELDRAVSGGDAGHYIISENLVGDHLTFKQALDEFFNKTGIDPSGKMKDMIEKLIQQAEKEYIDRQEQKGQTNAQANGEIDNDFENDDGNAIA